MFYSQQLDGTAIPSISSKLMAANSNQDGTISDERLISNVTGVIYAGLLTVYRVKILLH